MADRLRQAWRAFVWYVKAVMGDSDYERYVEHLAVHHPEGPVPTVKEYWRERYRRESCEPVSRCC